MMDSSWEYDSDEVGDTDEDEIDEESAGEEPELTESVEEVVEKPPFSLWSHQVANHLEEMTNFAETIETVGFFDWWEEFWREGLSPEEAAGRGLVQALLLEDE